MYAEQVNRRIRRKARTGGGEDSHRGQADHQRAHRPAVPAAEVSPPDSATTPNAMMLRRSFCRGRLPANIRPGRGGVAIVNSHSHPRRCRRRRRRTGVTELADHGMAAPVIARSRGRAAPSACRVALRCPAPGRRRRRYRSIDVRRLWRAQRNPARWYIGRHKPLRVRDGAKLQW